MAPSVTEAISKPADEVKAQEAPNVKTSAPPVHTPRENHREPLKLSGILDQFKSFDVTPVIGREYVDVNLAEWLKAPNSDELIRDLAITSNIHVN